MAESVPQDTLYESNLEEEVQTVTETEAEAGTDSKYQFDLDKMIVIQIDFYNFHAPGVKPWQPS